MVPSRIGPMVAGPHAQPAPSNAQILAQRTAAAMESDNAKRRARKPTDKNMPEGTEDIVIGDGVQQYKDMREVERRLDAVMMRKRLDLQDSRHQNHERTRTLRIWISNTAENQPWQGRDLDENAFDFSTGIEATYRVKIEGKLLDGHDPQEASDSEPEDEQDGKNERSQANVEAMDHDGEKEPDPPSKQHTPNPKKKLSHFFKSITVDFDRAKNLQPDGMTQIEWKKPPVPQHPPNLPASADFDCIEFERKSDENINCTLHLYRDEVPERFLLSKDLAEILDTEEDTRAGIVMGIWEYVKAMDLQQDEEKRLIQCDDRLRAVCAMTLFNLKSHKSSLLTSSIRCLRKILSSFLTSPNSSFPISVHSRLSSFLTRFESTLNTIRPRLQRSTTSSCPSKTLCALKCSQ